MTKRTRITTWQIRVAHRGLSGRRGMTLLELMVAMLVLLVGIWTIAAGFPKLLASISAEGERTGMARLAERNMERVKENDGALPRAIAGDPSISPFDQPEDLSDPSRLPNAQENVLDVIGEPFRIPAAQPYSGLSGISSSSAYVLQQGPAQWVNYPNTDSYPFVYMLVPMKEQQVDPRVAGNPMLRNSYYVDEAAGQVVVPNKVYTQESNGATHEWDAGEVMLSYGWAEVGGASNRPPVHYVQDERATEYTTSGNLMTFNTRASKRTLGTNNFSCLLADRTKVQTIVYFQREPWGVAEPTARGRYVLNNDYGVELRFYRDDAGLSAYVDYRLRDVNDTNGDIAGLGRRKLMMIEDYAITGEATRVDDVTGDRYTDIKLSASKIDSEMALFSHGLSGAVDGSGNLIKGAGDELTSDVFLLGVDLTTGEIYNDWDTLALYDDTLAPVLDNGYRDGVVAVRLDVGGTPQPYIGHTMRFYYTTLDFHNVQLQKPPQTFVDLLTAECYTTAYLAPTANEASELAQVDYRMYRVSGDPGDYVTPVTDMDRIVIEFVAYVDSDDDPDTPPDLIDAAAMEGHTVSVDYIWYDASDAPHYVYGEMHTVPQGAANISLQNFSYHRSDDYRSAEILAVRGISARALVWWQTSKGRQQHIGIDSYTLKSPLGFIYRTR